MCAAGLFAALQADSDGAAAALPTMIAGGLTLAVMLWPLLARATHGGGVDGVPVTTWETCLQRWYPAEPGRWPTCSAHVTRRREWE